MAYQFPLQKILDLKEKERELSRLALAESLEKKMEAEEEYRQVIRMRQEAEDELSQIPSRGVKISDMVEQYLFLRRTSLWEEEKGKKLKEASQKVEEEIDRVKGKEQEVKMYHRLREKDFGRWKREEERKEQKRLDEVSLQIYFKSQG